MQRLGQLISSIQTTRRMTLGLLDDFPDDRWTFSPVATGQHALWIIGHLAVADDWGLIALGVNQRHLVEFEQMFTRNRPIGTIAQDYPPPRDVLEQFHAAHQRLLDRLRVVTDDDLCRKTQGPISEFAPDLGTLMMSHIWHEGFHSGQLALIRRALGLPVKWG